MSEVLTGHKSTSLEIALAALFEIAEETGTPYGRIAQQALDRIAVADDQVESAPGEIAPPQQAKLNRMVGGTDQRTE